MTYDKEKFRKNVESLSEEDKQLLYNLMRILSNIDDIKFFSVGGIIKPNLKEWNRRRRERHNRFIAKIKEHYKKVKKYPKSKWKSLLEKMYDYRDYYSRIIEGLKKYKIE